MKKNKNYDDQLVSRACGPEGEDIVRHARPDRVPEEARRVPQLDAQLELPPAAVVVERCARVPRERPSSALVLLHI